MMFCQTETKRLSYLFFSIWENHRNAIPLPPRRCSIMQYLRRRRKKDETTTPTNIKSIFFFFLFVFLSLCFSLMTTNKSLISFPREIWKFREKCGTTPTVLSYLLRSSRVSETKTSIVVCCDCFSLASFVRFLLGEVTLLVSIGLGVPDRTFVGRELLELGGDHPCDVTERRLRVVRLDRGTDVDGVQEVRRHVPLGCVGVTLLLFALSASRVLHGNVRLHLVLVPELVLFGLLVPLDHLLVGEGLVLGRQDTGTVGFFCQRQKIIEMKQEEG
mmetsp:Transcript_54223/g.131558  ORF Transcript_54223/g.131558 Transcript_54223/m.131558 type:complete len:273 (-) Transcript_54223:990-1808(-)